MSTITSPSTFAAFASTDSISSTRFASFFTGTRVPRVHAATIEADLGSEISSIPAGPKAILPMEESSTFPVTGLAR